MHKLIPLFLALSSSELQLSNNRIKVLVSVIKTHRLDIILLR